MTSNKRACVLTKMAKFIWRPPDILNGSGGLQRIKWRAPDKIYFLSAHNVLTHLKSKVRITKYKVHVRVRNSTNTVCGNDRVQFLYDFPLWLWNNGENGKSNVIINNYSLIQSLCTINQPHPPPTHNRCHRSNVCKGVSFYVKKSLKQDDYRYRLNKCDLIGSLNAKHCWA